MDKAMARLHAKITAQILGAYNGAFQTLDSESLSADIDRCSEIATNIILKSSLAVIKLVKDLEDSESREESC